MKKTILVTFTILVFSSIFLFSQKAEDFTRKKYLGEKPPYNIDTFYLTINGETGPHIFKLLYENFPISNDYCYITDMFRYSFFTPMKHHLFIGSTQYPYIKDNICSNSLYSFAFNKDNSVFQSFSSYLCRYNHPGMFPSSNFYDGTDSTMLPSLFDISFRNDCVFSTRVPLIYYDSAYYFMSSISYKNRGYPNTSIFKIIETPDSLIIDKVLRDFYVDRPLKNFYINADNGFIYCFTFFSSASSVKPWNGGTNYIYRCNLKDLEKLDTKDEDKEKDWENDTLFRIQRLNTPYVHSDRFFGNNERLVWLMGKCDSAAIERNLRFRYRLPTPPAYTTDSDPLLPYKYGVQDGPVLTGYRFERFKGFRNTIDGIYFLEFKDNFFANSIRFNTGWDTIKSNLDNYFASHPKTDSIFSRYINMLGFRDNNVLIMLRDKWVDTNTIKKERNDSVDYNFDWYENTIYVMNFNRYPYWDTIDLHTGFSLLEQPEKWIVENRQVGDTNILSDVPIDCFGIYKWSDNELAVAIQPRNAMIFDPSFENANRVFLIYNINSMEWSKFVFPSSVVPYYSHKNVVEWREDKYFHITSFYQNDTVIFSNALLKYCPHTVCPPTGIKEIDDGIFIETADIRRIYPNPAKRSVIAEIMCYVYDRSKLDIGLYNMFGQKILDLNEYEYNDASKTIYMTIKLPLEYQEGVYFLNVRNGTEQKTRGIIFGK